MQYSLYIRKQVNEKFKDESDKSKLVNTLLEQFYGQLDEGFGRLEDGGKPQEFKLVEPREFTKPIPDLNKMQAEVDDHQTKELLRKVVKNPKLAKTEFTRYTGFITKADSARKKK